MPAHGTLRRPTGHENRAFLKRISESNLAESGPISAPLLSPLDDCSPHSCVRCRAAIVTSPAAAIAANMMLEGSGTDCGVSNISAWP